jgi:hypothetical protein
MDDKSEFLEPEIKDFIDYMLKVLDEHFFYTEFSEDIPEEYVGVNVYMDMIDNEVTKGKISFNDRMRLSDTFKDLCLPVYLTRSCDVFTHSLSKTLQEKLKLKYYARSETNEQNLLFRESFFSLSLKTRIRILHDARVLSWKRSLKKIMEVISKYWTENSQGSLTVLFEYLDIQ